VGRVSLNEIFENIKSNNVSIIDNQRRISKLIDKLKFLKIGRSALTEYNLSCSPKKPYESEKLMLKNESSEIENQENIPHTMSDKSFKKIDGDLNEQMSKLKIWQQLHTSSAESSYPTEDMIRENQDRKTKLYTSLYEVLRNRKQVPTQTINFDKLPVIEKIEGLKTMPIVLTDASFLNLKTQPSPNVSSYQPQLQQQQQSHFTLNQTESIYSHGPNFQMSSSPQIQDQFKIKQSNPLQQQPPHTTQLQTMPNNLQKMTSTPTVQSTFSFNNTSPLPASTNNNAKAPKNLFPTSNQSESSSSLKTTQTTAPNKTAVTPQPTENINKQTLPAVSPSLPGAPAPAPASAPSFSFNIRLGAPKPETGVAPTEQQPKPKQEEKPQPQPQIQSKIESKVQETAAAASTSTATPVTSLFGKTLSGTGGGAGLISDSFLASTSSTKPTGGFSFGFTDQKKSTEQFSFGASVGPQLSATQESSKSKQTSPKKDTTNTLSTVPTPTSTAPSLNQNPITVGDTIKNTTVELSSNSKLTPVGAVAPVAPITTTTTTTETATTSDSTKDTNKSTTGLITSATPTAPTLSQAPPSSTQSTINPTATAEPILPSTNATPSVSGTVQSQLGLGVGGSGLFDATKDQTKPPTSLFGNTKVTAATTEKPQLTGTNMFSKFLPPTSAPTASTSTAPTTSTATPALTNPFSAVAAATATTNPAQPYLI
jgi:hypothetical protein